MHGFSRVGAAALYVSLQSGWHSLRKVIDALYDGVVSSSNILGFLA